MIPLAVADQLPAIGEEAEDREHRSSVDPQLDLPLILLLPARRFVDEQLSLVGHKLPSNFHAVRWRHR